MKFKNSKKLSGDASFRNFYRNKKNKSIIVYCRKDKFKNLIVYDAINKLLDRNKIKTPHLLKENYKNNYIEISDLGNISGLKKDKKFQINNYLSLFNILIRFRKIRQKKIKTVLNNIYTIPKYTKNLIINETQLFSKWYIPQVIKYQPDQVSKKFNIIIKNLINNLKLKEKVFVHRDFHLSNTMYYKKHFFIIDSQDAVYGNQTYDLASLIDDVRIKTSLKNREKLFKKYLLKLKNISKSKFRNDFEILSVLRNFKIIGIFTRLSKRDKKHAYLKLIPYAWQLIDDRRNSNLHFKELSLFLEKYFPKKIRIQK